MTTPTPPPPLPPNPIDYSRRPDEPRVLFSTAAFVATAMPTFTLAIVLVFVVPRFESLFKDFKVELPGTTKVLLVVARMFSVWPLFLAPLVATGVGFAVAAAAGPPESAEDQRAHARLWMRLGLLATAVILALAVFALGAPLVSLLSAVSGPARKK